jgi:glycosyltransferase involved in cell wall biosynthesis
MNNLNLYCPINSTGYGITSLNIMKNLSHDLNVSYFPIGHSVEVNSEQDQKIVQDCLIRSSFFDLNAPSLKIWHQHELAAKIGNGPYYAYPFFELDTFTDREKHHLQLPDFIFTASHWGKKVLEDNGIKQPIYVAPLGVDLEIFKDPPKIKLARDSYIFFHIGKWEARKGHDFLIKSFEAAFTENDNVELWLLPHNPFLSQQETAQWLQLVENCKLKDKIRIFDKLPTQYHLAEFIFHGDCGVFLSRAEGWNNEILESMALNKPIITTYYSAHTEYCNENNSLLVSVDETEPANDNKWFFGHGKWAKFTDAQLEQTVHYMRYVYSNNIRTNTGGLEAAKQYSWKNTANIIKNHIYS